MLGVVRLEKSDCGYPITIAELTSVSRDLQKLLSEQEIEGLVNFLAYNPESGKIIPNTNGIRKLRWNMKGKGKSKGMRIIYYFHDLNMPLFMLAVYSKGETLRLSRREEMKMSRLVDQLKSQYSSCWEEIIKKQANRA